MLHVNVQPMYPCICVSNTGVSAKNRRSTVNFDRRRPIEEEIDRRWSIEREIDRRRSIEEEKEKKTRKRRKKRNGEERIPRPPAVAAHGSPGRRRRPRVDHGRGRFFSRARRQSVSPRREKDQGDQENEALPRPRAGRLGDASSPSRKTRPHPHAGGTGRHGKP
ncbi:hypothetical protein GW17_00042715 [Ensete ventricosum]|nr:hypothetical protein GW17_00042715 [Ensete ventricosum]